MPAATHPLADDSVDDYLRAFETARATGPVPDLTAFLPHRDHPLYLEVLRELVRIDLELGYRAGQARPLDEYLSRYPELARDPASLQEVAFEEYRQRYEAGQCPEAADYVGRYGISVAEWERVTLGSTVLAPDPGPTQFPLGAAPTQELAGLLQRRLAVAAGAWTLFFGYFAGLMIVNQTPRVGFSLGDRVTATLTWGGFLLCGSLLLGLTRLRLPLATLRWSELVLFGVVLGFLSWSLADDLLLEHELALPLAQGDHALFHYGSSWSLPFCALIVGYGVGIPSTLRRCLAVVSGMALLPLGVGLAAGLVERAFSASFVLSFLLQMALWLVGAAGLAVYGANRLETLRRAASAARQLGQYQLQRRLGSGGMGEVYLAEHVLLRRPCAVKVVRPERARDPAVLRRFEREVQVMATLRHPSAVQIYDYGFAADGTFYYVMEYLPGLTLEQLVARQGPLPPPLVVHLLLQVCGALRECHGRGLIHRDIKPSNVMTYDEAGLRTVAKLLDFGLVHVAGQGRAAREVAGTPAYMSPEQAAGRDDVDARTDLYSLGAVAYCLLTGRPPFAFDSTTEVLIAHLLYPVEPPASLRPEVPADLQAVVLRCLEKEPAARYPDAAALERALAACACASGWVEPT